MFWPTGVLHRPGCGRIRVHPQQHRVNMHRWMTEISIGSGKPETLRNKNSRSPSQLWLLKITKSFLWPLEVVSFLDLGQSLFRSSGAHFMALTSTVLLRVQRSSCARPGRSCPKLATVERGKGPPQKGCTDFTDAEIDENTNDRFGDSGAARVAVAVWAVLCSGLVGGQLCVCFFRSGAWRAWRGCVCERYIDEML